MHGHNRFSDHCTVKCVMDFNVNYESGNTGANGPIINQHVVNHLLNKLTIITGAE